MNEPRYNSPRSLLIGTIAFFLIIFVLALLQGVISGPVTP